MEYFDEEEYKSDCLMLDYLQEEKDKILKYLTEQHKFTLEKFKDIIEPPPFDDIPF